MSKYIKLNVHVISWSTGGYDPDDSWSRDSTDGSVSILSASIANDDGYDVLPTKVNVEVGDTIYVVWAQYSTGDSFGCDGGQYELLEIAYDEKTAYERKEHYLGVKDYSVPWNGYFEHLDGIYVDRFILQNNR